MPRDTSGFITTSIRAERWMSILQEREAFWERLYNSPGFGVWVGNFKDTLVDSEANAVSKFVAVKIRERVRDPDVAEKLVPKDHGFGMTRSDGDGLLRGLQPGQRSTRGHFGNT